MKHYSKIAIGLLAIALISTIYLLMLPAISNAANVVGPNYKNVTVRTQVNITHSKPDVLNVTVYEAINMSARNITISAGGIKQIYCNATVRSWEGFNDITVVNATLFNQATSSLHAPDDNNSHYTNASCTLNASISQFIGWYACSFDVYYYANNGTWFCNVTVQNSYTNINSNFTGSNHGTTTFFPVYALNVTDGIDYGGVAVEEYSVDKTANLTNLGNMGINITVEGYGARRGDGLAMNCSLTGNITVENERFTVTNNTIYASKTPLVGTLGGTIIPGLTMPKQNSSQLVVNTTYWQLYIPPNPAGNCSGSIIFTAVAP